MSAINDLLAQIEDRALQERLQTEFTHLINNKKFGLVFEEHLPEVVPLYQAEIDLGDMVALRKGDTTDLWRVLSLSDDREQAECLRLVSQQTSFLPIRDLVAVKRFGDPIFPALVPIDAVQNNNEDNAVWHSLIEADNYHALQLLEYMYMHTIDLIYIDPPYNKGARDWKYNNDYVDSNDSWKHSKWLAMMNRRLKIARRLLNPETGVLIVTIDEHEHHHLRTLLQQIFPGAWIQTVTIVINPKGVTQGRFSRVEEYAIYCFMPNAYVHGGDDPLLGNKSTSNKPRWKGLLRSGTNARREDSKNQFYPVLVDPINKRVIRADDTLPFGEAPNLDLKIDGYNVAWPIKTDLSEGNWGISNTRLNTLVSKGYVALGRYDDKRKTWGISYLSEKPQQQIETGELIVIGYDEQRNVVDVEYADVQEKQIKTVWHRNIHDAGAYGSDLVSKITGQPRAFTFPKSLYAVRDCLSAIVKDKPNALILDFFAGSGTTLHAVHLLNEKDQGHRRCIMVTNNEVAEDVANAMKNKGVFPGDEEWEKQGVCQAVAWPRSRNAILGCLEDGSQIEGEYYTGKHVCKEKERSYYHLDFIARDKLRSLTQKKNLLKVIEGIPQATATPGSAFALSGNESHFASVLFDENEADAWIDALADCGHITSFYIVASDNASFANIKNRISELLGPVPVTEEKKRAIKDGFSANLEYFRLSFLDKNNVILGDYFHEILPLLWMRSGSVGPRPEIARDEPLPSMLVPEGNSFAVLVDETKFTDFLIALEPHGKSITHIYLVTDSEEAFQEMAEGLEAPYIIQLYKDYIENFAINREAT